MHLSERAIEICAAAAHMANRAHYRAIGDMSQPTWTDAPDWQKSSARKGIVGVLVDGLGPREIHESWLKDKADGGWKWGPLKDPERKEHPCFLPYDKLPAAQQAKNEVYISTVKAVYAALNEAAQGPGPKGWQHVADISVTMAGAALNQNSSELAAGALQLGHLAEMLRGLDY